MKSVNSNCLNIKKYNSCKNLFGIEILDSLECINSGRFLNCCLLTSFYLHNVPSLITNLFEF